jgi:hypothetical protein
LEKNIVNTEEEEEEEATPSTPNRKYSKEVQCIKKFARPGFGRARVGTIQTGPKRMAKDVALKHHHG